MAVDYTKYSGNNDFRGFLAANAPGLLSYTGNDGGLNVDAYNRATYGTGKILGNGAVDVRMAKDSGYNDNLSATKSAIGNLYNGWVSSRPRNDSADSPVSSSYGTSYGGSGGSGTGYSAADLAYLDDQEARLRAQQGSADRALNNGITQLGDSYNKEVSGANSARSRALEDFQLKREDTTRAKDSALNKVDTGARTLADSLRRRIGMASGSGSSAYQFAAPGAVAKQASEQRGGVQENFGVNFRNLGQAEDRAKADFDSLLQDLDSQKRTRESEFRSGILDRKNQIDMSLSELARQRALAKGGGYAQVKSAMAPYASAIDSRQGEIDSLFERFRTPFNVKAVNVQAPELRDYTVDNATIGQTQSPTDPYTESLRKRQLEEDNSLL